MRKVRADRLSGEGHLSILCSHDQGIFIPHFLFDIFLFVIIFLVSDYGKGVTTPLYLSLFGKTVLSEPDTHSSHTKLSSVFRSSKNLSV